MSQENVEIVRCMYDAFNQGDVARARESLHPDAELHQLAEGPLAGSHYGRDEWARGFALWLSEFEQSQFEPREVTQAGDCVIMRVLLSGRGRASGVETRTELFHAWTVRDGMPHR